MDNLVEQAVANGFAEEHVGGLRDLVHEFPDVFRLHFGNDTPADVEPLGTPEHASTTDGCCFAAFSVRD